MKHDSEVYFLNDPAAANLEGPFDWISVSIFDSARSSEIFGSVVCCCKILHPDDIAQGSEGISRHAFSDRDRR